MEKFETFEKSRDTWNGFAENLNLFNYWLSLKKKVPAVISSLKWKKYYKDKENKKQKVLLQKEEKRTVKKKQEKL